MFDGGIGFRDRALKVGEKSNYYCRKCGAELHPDTMRHHKCQEFSPSTAPHSNTNKGGSKQ